MSGGTVKEIYDRDWVSKFDKQEGVIFGIVSERYDDEFSTLQKGQIRVSWSNSPRSQICHESQVHLMSRNFSPGDIVQRFEEGQETQRGYCKKVNQFATVQIVESNKVIEHIPENRLCSVNSCVEDFFCVGNAVCMGDKFGRIQGIDRLITMHSQCGSVVEVRSSINNNIRDYWNHSKNGFWADHGHPYPGQTVICTPVRLADPNWLNLSSAMERNMRIDQTFTIQSVDIYSIKVSWYTDDEIEYAELKEDEIRRLKVLPYTRLDMCERHLLKLEQADILLEKSEWLKKISLQHFPDRISGIDNLTLVEPIDAENDEEESDNNEEVTNVKRRKKDGPTESDKFSTGSIVAVEVLCIDSRATVVWQDGTEEKYIPTIQLYHPVSMDDHEFFPGEWVFSNADDNLDRYGVVQRVNFLERTAEIKWFTYSDDHLQPQEIIASNQVISVYDLEIYDDYVFRPGEVVKAEPTQNDKMGKVVDSSAKGYIIVEWLDGTWEKCWPQDIEVIPEREANLPRDLDHIDDLHDFWDSDGIELIDDDIADEIDLQSVATKVDYMRTWILLLKTLFRESTVRPSLPLKDFLRIYLNCSYLDKYLGTSLFRPESNHLQLLLQEVKKIDEPLSDVSETFLSIVTNREKENLKDIINLKNKFFAQIESNGDPPTSDISDQSEEWQQNSKHS